MRVRSALRRFGLTIPFLVVATLVLVYFSAPVVNGPAPVSGAESSFLIVTTEALRPAFEAFEDWNLEQGCPVALVSLPEGETPKRVESMVAYLGALCALRGSTGLVLGGDRQLVPFLEREELPQVGSALQLSFASMAPPRLVPIPPAPGSLLPEGLRVGRAPVRDLDEAWEFVDACRASGRTLESLLATEVIHSFTAIADPHPSLRPASTHPSLSRFAVPVVANP